MELTRILCLDLDGTVRRSKSGKTFIEGPKDVEIIPGMKKLIWYYYHLGYAIVGISNQAGVAHGFKTEQQVVDENNAMAKLLWVKGEQPFQFCMICPYDATGKVEGYNFRSLSRKPGYGMLVIAEDRLMSEMDITPDWDNSLFVGDRPEDEECAKAAGIPFKHIDEFLKTPI